MEDASDKLWMLKILEVKDIKIMPACDINMWLIASALHGGSDFEAYLIKGSENDGY